MRRYIAFAAALVCAVLLSYAVGTSAQSDKVSTERPLSLKLERTQTVIPCDSDALLATGTFTPTTDQSYFRITFRGKGKGHIYFDPVPWNQWTGLRMFCPFVLSPFEFTATVYDPGRTTQNLRVRAQTGPCYDWGGPMTVEDVTVTVLPGPPTH